MKSFVLGVVQWLWTSFAQLMRLICQDVSKMANDMAKLAEVAEVSGAQVHEVRFLEKSLFETASRQAKEPPGQMFEAEGTCFMDIYVAIC